MISLVLLLTVSVKLSIFTVLQDLPVSFQVIPTLLFDRDSVLLKKECEPLRKLLITSRYYRQYICLNCAPKHEGQQNQSQPFLNK